MSTSRRNAWQLVRRFAQVEHLPRLLATSRLALASAVEYRPAAALIPYARNSRTHSDAQVAQIAASIREFGWTNPILVDGDNGIIAGHGRLLAARKLGMSTVPVIELAGLSEAQKRAYVIADNKLALNAGWDNELLGLELGELDALGFDLSLTGFGEDEIATLTSLGTRRPYRSGRHSSGARSADHPPRRCLDHGQAPADLRRQHQRRGRRAGARRREAASSRFGSTLRCQLRSAWRQQLGNSRRFATGKVMNDDRADWREAWALFPGDVAYVWHGALHASTVAASLEASGFAVRSQIIWDKTRLVIGRGDYHWQHEPAWYAVRKGRKGHWAGDRKQTTVWAIPHRKSPTGHGTEKPVECMRRPIENNSSPGQAA